MDGHITICSATVQSTKGDTSFLVHIVYLLQGTDVGCSPKVKKAKLVLCQGLHDLLERRVLIMTSGRSVFQSQTIIITMKIIIVGI